MTMTNVIPHWLKEVLDRGYQPKQIYRPFDKGLFGYIKSFSASTYSFPDKLIFTLEGIPGSGKTSILEMFDKEKGIKTIPQILPREPKFDQTESQYFYFKSDKLKTETALSAAERLVLMDRYYVSTLAFY